MMNSSRIKNSRHLAHLLRHTKAVNYKGGWVELSVAIETLQLPQEEIAQIVECDSKGRFEFSSDGRSLRALYGHSVEVDLELEPVTPPDVLYHGTAEKYMDSILREGLKPRKRCYVHLSETRDMALEVGSRHGTPVVLVVDSAAMAQRGVRFYKAHRGVWLVDGVSPEYINIDSSEY
jgi:putative RNA 2'-phosphotransferase